MLHSHLHGIITFFDIYASCPVFSNVIINVKNNIGRTSQGQDGPWTARPINCEIWAKYNLHASVQ